MQVCRENPKALLNGQITTYKQNSQPKALSQK